MFYVNGIPVDLGVISPNAASEMSVTNISAYDLETLHNLWLNPQFIIYAY